MKFLISLILTALLSAAICLYLPWWSIAIVAFMVAALINLKPTAAFFSGFLGLLLLWGGIAWYISSSNDDLLAHKVSVIVLEVDNPMMLIGGTAIIGAVVAGFAALAGSYMRA